MQSKTRQIQHSSVVAYDPVRDAQIISYDRRVALNTALQLGLRKTQFPALPKQCNGSATLSASSEDKCNTWPFLIYVRLTTLLSDGHHACARLWISGPTDVIVDAPQSQAWSAVSSGAREHWLLHDLVVEASTSVQDVADRMTRVISERLGSPVRVDAMSVRVIREASIPAGKPFTDLSCVTPTSPLESLWKLQTGNYEPTTPRPVDVLVTIAPIAPNGGNTNIGRDTGAPTHQSVRARNNARGTSTRRPSTLGLKRVQRKSLPYAR